MRIDRSGVPFVLAAWAPAAVLFLLSLPVPAFLCVLLGGFFIYFFRDPDRSPPAGEGLVVAPADGRIVVAGDVTSRAAPAGSWQQVSIFLSPLDVHVNRAPVAGLVTRVHYEPGRFLPAYRQEADTENERNEVWFEHVGCTVICRQVVGVLARRIVCRIGAGDVVQIGQRFGIMKFGSRIDLFLPPDAHVRVAKGDRVTAGESVVAQLRRGDPALAVRSPMDG